MTPDVEVHAAYASVVEDEGTLFVGFPEGEDETDPYVLFRQSVTGGPVWFEMDDELFGADDAVERLVWTAKGPIIYLTVRARARFAHVSVIEVTLPDPCDARDEAEAALAQMLGHRFQRG